MLQTDRPGRVATSEDETQQALKREAEHGRLDATVVAAFNGSPPAYLGVAAVSPRTYREIEVLSRISHGANNKDRARTLGISPSTVRSYVENIFRKLECSTRAAATLKALTTGLI
jgi:DNA-binding NarL/FixJ family response regulator